ncbi:unnamed protein product [Trifolium pratense]|uniref:Uncharacterized protein n=1 Tax=Trifolium pratense TaxID=57577 RepID=A0ACB0MB55_TRIPR|nr:unnamed protein product [Trifolium pratense]
MKGIDMFCSSPASTAIIHSNMDQRSMLRRSRTTKTYDQRKNQLHHVPCSSQLPINPMPYFEKHRKSSSDKQNSSTTTDTRRKSSANVNDLSSRRYLLDDTPFIDWLSESNKILVPRGEAEAVSMDKKRKNDSHALVVVLRVSLHCKACEGKVRKHISKMEGVRSFNIEMETKKVTIIGAVTPLDVLASVSKVKSAQLWPSSTSSSSSSRLTFP